MTDSPTPPQTQRFRIAVRIIHPENSKWSWLDCDTSLPIEAESESNADWFIQDRLRQEYKAGREFRIIPGPPFSLPTEPQGVQEDAEDLSALQEAIDDTIGLEGQLTASHSLLREARDRLMKLGGDQTLRERIEAHLKGA